MQLFSRIGCGAMLAVSLAMAGCATQQPATKVSTVKSGDDQKLALHIYPSTFEVPAGKNVRAIWLAYGGFRLLWLDQHYPQDPSHYVESPEETLASMDFMAKTWERDQDHKPGDDTYLDTLAEVDRAGYLKEYVWDCMTEEGWSAPPADLRRQEFTDWMTAHATNFNSYQWGAPAFEDGKASFSVHEPLAAGYCLTPKAASPTLLSLSDADAKIVAAEKLLQQGGSAQVPSLLDEAVQAYETAIAKQGGTPRCFYKVAEYYGYRNLHPAEHTLVMDPAYCDALHIQGYLQSSLHDWDAARTLLEREHELSPYAPEPLTELGYITQATAGPQQAVGVYWSALRLAESDTEHTSSMTGILRRIGEAYIDLKQYDDARGALGQALSLDPNDAGTKRELQYLEQVSGKH